MGSSIVTLFLLTVGVYLLVQSAPTSDVTSGVGPDHVRGHGRPSLLPRLAGSRAVKYIRSRILPADSQSTGDDFVMDDDDVIEFNKRQSEDYGHMRFGKREDQFDDYGHMRFGRSLDH